MNGLRNVQTSGNRIARLGKILGTGVSIRRAIILRDQPRPSSPINDNYFVNSLQEGLLAGSQTISQDQTLNFVKCHVAKVVHSAPGHSQKKELSPGSAACYIQRNHRLKYVKNVSCVTQLSCVPPVINVQSVAQNLPVGARLQNFWKTWLNLGAGPKVVPPVPRRLRARSHQACLQHTQTLVEICQDLGWLVNLDKSELDPKQIFDFVGYQFDLQAGRVRPTPDRWQSLQGKILEILSLPTCPVRQFMSLIGLLTATEKQVHLGRLHMRPIQWHLKNHWRIPESLEKVIPIPRSLHPHLQWWLQEDDVLTGQPLHPIRHALQIFTDASKEGWGAHLNERTARGTWSLPESKLHINYLELKAVFLALKEFQDLCANRIVLVATDNTTVVSYINKEGGMRSDTLCALLWRTLTWCTRHQVTLKARHIPGRLNVVADKLSRLG